MRVPVTGGKGEGDDVAYGQGRFDFAVHGGGPGPPGDLLGDGGFDIRRASFIVGADSILGRACGHGRWLSSRILDGLAVCSCRSRHPGAVGPAEKSCRLRPLPTCQKPDDFKRAVFVAGRSVDFSILADWRVGVVFFAVNFVYFLLSEEKALERRFGDEYVAYKANVPRWLPRLNPWPRSEQGGRSDG